MPGPAGLLPTSILLWRADEVREPSAPCCLCSARAGSRAAVYRTRPDGGVVGLVDVLADAATTSHAGWAASCVFTRLDRLLFRSVLLADDVLGPVFQ